MFGKIKTKTFLWFLGGAIAENVLMFAFLTGIGGEQAEQAKELIILNIIVLWVGGMARILIDWQKYKKGNKNG